MIAIRAFPGDAQAEVYLGWRETQLASTTQLAGINGGRERIVALGVNWYLNRNVRMILDDNIVRISKGIATNLDRDSQDFNVVGLPEAGRLAAGYHSGAVRLRNAASDVDAAYVVRRLKDGAWLVSGRSFGDAIHQGRSSGSHSLAQRKCCARRRRGSRVWPT